MPRVIKEHGASQNAGLGRLAVLNVANFAEQAKKMILCARAESSEITTRANAEAKEVTERAAYAAAAAKKHGHEQGYAAGHAEGCQKGYAEGQADGAERAFNESMEMFRQQTADLQTMLTQAVQQVQDAHEDILQQARTDLLELALATAERITKTLAVGDVEMAKANLIEAIEMVGCKSHVQARACPAQLDQLQEYAGQFLAEMGMFDVVKLTPDETLSPGDVVVRGRDCQVDARVQTQIDKVVGAVTGRTE